MPARHWRHQAGRLILGAVFVLLIGWLAGDLVIIPGIAVALFIAWQAYNLWRLYRWAQAPSSDLPKGRGIWADIFDAILKLEKRFQQQQDSDREEIRKLRNLTNALPDATLLIDGNDSVTWFNRAAEELLAVKSPDDLGRPLTNLIREPGFPDWLHLQGELTNPLEMPSPRDRQRWLIVNAVILPDSKRLIVLRDITGVHNLESVKRDFVANVSHELRTPLTVVQGYLELLDPDPASEMSAPVKKMLKQTRHMQSLLNDVMELSRVQGGELHGGEEVVDVPALLARLKDQAEELSRNKHDMRFDIDPGLQLCGYSSDLESAFGNLIGNAIKYTPEGKPITVSWKDSTAGPQFIVEDSGIGIPRRDIPRLTERFYRVDAANVHAASGTGLGLAIVKHVLIAHQAELLIDSLLGEGSTFTALFPPARRQIKQERTSSECCQDGRILDKAP